MATSGEEKIMSAVDYVTVVLLNDQVGVLQRIDDDFAVTTDEAKCLTDFLELMRNFSRQQYDTHASNDTYSFHTHGILYGLEKPDPSEQERIQDCSTCNFVAFYFEELRTCISESEHRPHEIMQDALEVVGDIQGKVELYRAHRVKVANQQCAIQSLHQDLEGKCKTGEATNHAIVVMDWKMKFESMSARETTQQYFGKRGIGWHGFLASYYKLDGTDTVRYTVHCDQILEGSNKQDGLAVASMLEAFLRQIKLELPFIDYVTLQSDNAGCYQTNELLLLFPLISHLSLVKVTRFFTLKRGTERD